MTLRGISADAAISFVVGGTPAVEDLAMIEATERALAAGIAAARPGARIGDLSHAIGTVLHDAGYPINLEFGGHGIGSTMHQDPHIANDGRPGRGYTLRPGLLLALEPWSWPTPTCCAPTTTAGPCGARPDAAPHTPSTRSRSLRTGRDPDTAEILTLPRS